MNQSNLATINTEKDEVKTYDLVNAGELLLNANNFNMLHQFAEVMSKGVSTVPKHLAGNIGDCMAVAMQALQWGMNPYAVAQKTHLVNGTLGYEAQLVNAVVQSSGAIKGSFKYEYQGEGNALLCRVGAVLAGERDVTWGEWLSINQVKTKNSPLWVTNPKQQIGYLQVKNWARAYCPGAILGVYTPDELEKEESLATAGNTIDQKKLPEYEGKRFDANFPKYSKAISEGTKTAKEIIDIIESKYTMNDDQKQVYIDLEQDIEGAKS